MRNKLLWIVAFTFSFVLGQTAFAHSGCGERMTKMVDSLSLDDAQKAKIKPILEQLKMSMKDNMTQMKDLRTQINQQVTSDKMDQSTVDGLVDKKVKMMGDMMKANMMAKNQIFNVLTAQQKTKFQNSVKDMESKMVDKMESCQEQK